MKRLTLILAFLTSLAVHAQVFPTAGLAAPTTPLTCTISTATSICLTSAPYYASTAGATTTTVSGTFTAGTTGTIASCSTFLPNEGIAIAGAGTAGGLYIGTVVSCASGALAVTPATTTTVASSNVVQHDDTAAWIAAFAAANPGGMNIYAPCGKSLANGPLLDTSGANAVLPVPKIANYSSAPTVISIIGCATPLWSFGSEGSIIQTSAPSGNLFGGYDSATGGGFPNFTNVWLKMSNITLRSYPNPGVVMVNATNILAFQGDHLVCDTGSTSNNPHSNTAGACYLMPTVANNVDNDLTDVNAYGYYTLYRLTEHTHVTRAYGVEGTNCWQIDSGVGSSSGPTNSVSINYAWDQQCTNDIVGPASGSEPVPVNITNMDMETTGTLNIKDPNNKLQGIIDYNIPYTSASLAISGGTGLILHNLQGTQVDGKALANGMAATTQTTGDNTTKVATDAFVIANASASGVASINGVAGAYTFTGGGVGCTGTTCTFGGVTSACETHAASNSASLNFTSWYNSAYKVYTVTATNIAPATNGVSIYVRFSTDGGSSYDSTATHYNWSRMYQGIIGVPLTAVGTGNTNGSTGDSGLTLWSTDLSSSSSLVSTLTLYDPANTTFPLKADWHTVGENTANVYYQILWAGFYNQTGSAINALQVIPSSGNITSGQVSVCPVVQ